MPAIVKDIKCGWENRLMPKSKAEIRSERERRLARALKENLKRRKEKTRERQGSETEKAAEADKGGSS
jgi:hypothetical protein